MPRVRSPPANTFGERPLKCDRTKTVPGGLQRVILRVHIGLVQPPLAVGGEGSNCSDAEHLVEASDAQLGSDRTAPKFG